MRLDISITRAVSSLVAGFRLSVSHPAIQKQVFRGIVLNALLFLVLMVAVLWGAWALTGLLIGDEWHSALLGWLTRILVLGGLLFASPVIYALGGEIVLPGPRGKIFRLARKSANGPDVVEPEGGIVDEIKMVGWDIRRLGRFLGFSALAFLLNFIPVLGNLAYVAIQALIAAHTMGWDILSRHFELHGLDYGQQKAVLGTNRLLVISVGGAAIVLCLIPIAQLVFITTNVAGAGVLSARLDGAQ